MHKFGIRHVMENIYCPVRGGQDNLGTYWIKYVMKIKRRQALQLKNNQIATRILMFIFAGVTNLDPLTLYLTSTKNYRALASASGRCWKITCSRSTRFSVFTTLTCWRERRRVGPSLRLALRSRSPFAYSTILGDCSGAGHRLGPRPLRSRHARSALQEWAWKSGCTKTLTG